MIGLILGAMAYAFVSAAMFENYGVGLMAGVSASMVWGALYGRWFMKKG